MVLLNSHILDFLFHIFQTIKDGRFFLIVIFYGSVIQKKFFKNIVMNVMRSVALSINMKTVMVEKRWMVKNKSGIQKKIGQV